MHVFVCTGDFPFRIRETIYFFSFFLFRLRVARCLYDCSELWAFGVYALEC